MYNLSLVRKKKKIRRAAIISTIGGIGVTAMVIVAFLGRTVGTFTVIVNNEGVALTMDTKSNFEHQTSYLNAEGLDKFSGAHTYKWFLENEKYSFQKIHNEETSPTLDLEKGSNGIRFFKYTFFIKNIGTMDASYNMSIDLTENVKPTNGAYSVDYYLRMAVFEGEENYTPEVYAQRSLYKNEEDELDGYREYISGKPGTNNYYGEAKTFETDTRLAKIENSLLTGEVRMYTLLFWLEGEDPECTIIPDNASLKIGATIDAFPQDKEAN